MLNGIAVIVGRTNVGKSTLFNRFTKTRKAITDDEPGVTRDRIYAPVYFDTEKQEGFMLVDTGGFETEKSASPSSKPNPFRAELWLQTKIAIDEADVLLFVVDAKAGLHPHDKELLQYLKNTGKQVIGIVNKVDGTEQEQALWEFYELGVTDMLPISAAYNRGTEKILALIKKALSKNKNLSKIDLYNNATSVAIIGRPNAGKSSILNRILGEERALVSDIPGTTRDSIDTQVKYNKKEYILIDTSGIRRRSKIDKNLENFAVIRSLEALERAHIILLILDAKEGLSDQDTKLANLAISRYKPLIVIVNKWDLVPNKTAKSVKDYTKEIYRKLGDISYVPTLFVSCKENQRVHKILSLVERITDQYQHRAETAELNRALEAIVHEHTPALTRAHGKRIKFYYATQASVKPPTIVIFCNVAREIQATYQRYMTKKFQSMLGFDEIPVKIVYKPKKAETSESK